ncbi:MAG: hypothetical protein EOO50_14295 [Flavobacterium sp.]|uniref:hypothetical protein n=1 Tax=Flavobacterium sp. TaxID=239 RepID=UPI0011F5A292|nr:hypothetical protein [Flavobacterium sp.]RZJ65345.1 MAG: hypothetical protein EOO50_14295 [Flavobacterium sp.]
MKTHYFSTRSTSYGILLGMFAMLLASCGTSRNTASNDGIYGDNQTADTRQENTNNGYRQYFNSLQDDEIITDVERYSSVQDSTQRTDDGYAEGYSSWGGNADNVTINVYDNNWGYGYWNNYWYGGGWGWGLGWNSWYGPGWGWNYGYGWGGYPYYGYGYGGYPYYGGYYGNGYYGNGYAYNNGPRGGRNYTMPGGRYSNSRSYSTPGNGRRSLTYSTNGTRNSYNGTRGTRNFTNNGTRNQTGGTRNYGTPRTNNSYNTPRSTGSQPRSYSTPSRSNNSYTPSSSSSSGGRSYGGGSYSGGGGGGGRSGGGGGGGRR